ncbi:TetR family transcriptional regulator [Streptomyces sp. NRRL F-4489]|uniref:TetR/AcrR family transcriptional regulator n=1 Tax=Streptomyces sp. NRRL F-4489 TaxID=1609095 RepID=UPI00074856D9|nr:TetR/AcrR family transcriptional regulator [Streptomyces sp. NRRL F-4489]KUL53297.1 TetR family transcriptional regulator [Streptomyces sp. NRRL F-4489]
MPSAREALLDAAYTAVLTRPWTAVRMVEVAAAAGVSRQTLYNEFGGKDGLARALVRRETEAYLAGVERALGAGAPGAADGDAAARMAAAAAWTVRTARTNPLVRAALTGCRPDRLPTGRTAPAELVGRFRERAVAALAPGRPREELPALAAACEAAVRLTLSWVVAPALPDPVPDRAPGRGPGAVPRQRGPRRDAEAEAEAVARLVRGAFAGLAAGGPGEPGAVSAPSRTAAARPPRR